jgi:hypothetical protein
MEVTGQTHIKELHNVKTQNRIDYLQEKISQWDFLDSMDESWDESDLKQRESWGEEIEKLSKEFK